MKGEIIMPSYRDETTGKWYCKFYYEDYTGKRHQKKKRGFGTKREAQNWEREFLLKQQGSTDMLFKDLTQLYLDDLAARTRPNTVNNKRQMLNRHVLPAFGDMPVNEISPAKVRAWQNDLTAHKTKAGTQLKPTTLREINFALSSVFNYAKKFYGLRDNPCHLAGSIGSAKAGQMQFWTLEEFKQFISAVDDIQYHALFMVLYYTGLRISEALMLTPADIDLETGIIDIKVSKTPKGVRKVHMPDFLIKELREYYTHLYDLYDDFKIFYMTPAAVRYMLNTRAEAADVKRIRIHDLRHSHVALLVEMGANPLLIAERLGHEDIKMTLNTYAHLYPNKQRELIIKLNKIVPF